MICDLFEHYNVEVMTSTKLVEVTDDGAVVETNEVNKTLKADTVVSALGFKPVESLKDMVAELNVPVYEVGDSKGAAQFLMLSGQHTM